MKRVLLTTLCALSLLLLTESSFAEEKQQMQWIDTDILEADTEFADSHQAVIDVQTQQRSMFCWYTDFSNEAYFTTYLPVFQKFGINRLYVEIPKKCFSQMQTVIMIKHLKSIGIEPVLLLGSREWIHDGLDDYSEFLQALIEYNDGIGKQYPINAVALNVEADTLPEWKEDPGTCFDCFIQIVEDAYSQAHNDGLQVIQVVSTRLDQVGRDHLEEFITHCCDELSLMNYR